GAGAAQPGPFTPEQVIGMLSAPGENVAVIRGLSGPAADRGAGSQPVAFRYQLTTEVQPFTNGASGNLQLQNYLHEVRLRFEWPLRPDGVAANRPGSGSPKTFRMLVSGRLEQTNNLAYFRQ
ncbi:MAG: hypothetical protein Q7U75_12670, partial [Desulfobacterales bacterium]|nr:hypothetical protein [Desulfobacterales bacterium]